MEKSDCNRCHVNIIPTPGSYRKPSHSRNKFGKKKESEFCISTASLEDVPTAVTRLLLWLRAPVAIDRSLSLSLSPSLLLSLNSAQDSKESVQGPVVFRRSIFMCFSPPLPPGLCELQVRRERSCPSGLISTL